MARWPCCKHFVYTKYASSCKPHNNPIEEGTIVLPILLVKQLSHRQINHLLKITQLRSGEAGFKPGGLAPESGTLGLCAICLSSHNNKKASAPQSA